MPSSPYQTLEGGKARTKTNLPLSPIQRQRAQRELKGSPGDSDRPLEGTNLCQPSSMTSLRGVALLSIFALLNFTSLSLRFLICAPGQGATVNRLFSSPLLSIPRLFCHGEIEPLLSETHRPHLPGLRIHNYGKEDPVNVNGIGEEDHQL